MLISLWPIVIAALSSVIIAFVWFHPKVFGASFMREVNLTPEQQEKGKRRMFLYVFFAFLASLVMAYVMSYFLLAWGVYDWIGALELGFWCWVGFIAPPMLGSVLWEMRSIRHYVVVAGYWLLTSIVMAQVLLF
jgi:hypothetical protein